jgi:hypothetical protein
VSRQATIAASAGPELPRARPTPTEYRAALKRYLSAHVAEDAQDVGGSGALWLLEHLDVLR